MKLTPDQTQKVRAILEQPDDGVVALTRATGLDPQRHFVGADLRGLDFRTDDVGGFMFTRADLRGADLSRARGLRPEMFGGARWDEHTKAPPGLFGPAKPDWADTIGQDEFGTFVTIVIPAKRGAPVHHRLRWIPEGTFMMGSPDQEDGRFDDEGPRHRVTIPHGFWLFDYPCTQIVWEAVMGSNLSQFVDPARPVENVSRDDVAKFLKRINRLMPGLELSLPSETQWEYACRAGTDTATYAGDASPEVLGQIAWYQDNSDGQTHPVGQKAPNQWGLYDMLGNVFEWCADLWHGDYAGAPVDGAMWERGGEAGSAVVRGGSWSGQARYARAAYRYPDDPGGCTSDLGFRLARAHVQSGAQAGAAGSEEKASRSGAQQRRRPARSAADGPVAKSFVPSRRKK